MRLLRRRWWRVFPHLAVAGGVLVFAASALASGANVDYAVPPGAGYSVVAHGQGLVDVAVNQCVTGGKPFPLPVDVQIAKAGSASSGSKPWTYKWDASDGGTVSFDPSSLSLVPGAAPKRVTLMIRPAVPSENGSAPVYRFKVVPVSGNGQSHGVRITFDCSCRLTRASAPTPLGCCPPRAPPRRDRQPSPGERLAPPMQRQRR
jgi:hypothetical protein